MSDEFKMNDERIKKKILEDPNLTEKQKEALIKTLDKKQEQLDQTGLKVKIAVGKEEKTDAEEEIKRLREELEDRDSKLQLVFEKEMARKKKALGIPENADLTPEQLKAIEEWGTRPQSGSVPAPNVPLNAAQMGQTTGGFSSYEEMIEDLRRRERQGDAQAKQILRELYRKALSGAKSSGKPIPTYEDNTEPPLAEIKRRSRIKRRSDDQ